MGWGPHLWWACTYPGTAPLPAGPAPPPAGRSAVAARGGPPQRAAPGAAVGSAGAVVVPGARWAARNLVIVPLVSGPVVAVVGDHVPGYIGGVRHPCRSAVPARRGGRGRGRSGGRGGRRRHRGVV